MDEKQIVIYTSRSGIAELEIKIEQETVWLTQKQMANLFNKDIRTINEHIGNVFKEKELDKKSVIRKFRITASDGKTYDIEHYSLDVIISVGYRVKSLEGTRFRQWATRTLKDFALKGYAINQKRLEQKGYIELEQAVDLVSKTVRTKQLQASEAKGLLSVITEYMQTWILLQAYDDGTLKPAKSNKPIYSLELAEAQTVLTSLKAELVRKKEASQLFAQERSHGLSAIIGSINQSFGGKDVYPTIAQKAAHLLYFVVKDHPFTDGNKRSGAMLFIWYLGKNKKLSSKLNEQTLAAITLLVAESNPKQKDIMVKLISNLIA